jgi:hypothetical protein
MRKKKEIERRVGNIFENHQQSGVFKYDFYWQ